MVEYFLWYILYPCHTVQICFDSPVCVGFVIWTSHFSKIIQLYLAVSKNEHLFVGGIYSASELQNLPMWKSSKKKWWLICKMHFFQTLLILGSLLLWSVFEVRKALHINTEPSEEIKIRVERTEGKKKHVFLANEDNQRSIQEWH